MEQTASTALIAAIVAVVLGVLGLVGGVIGYVQGTAALRRATLTRQRASAAEEAALQARAQAEQAARTAQSVLDRLSGLRGVSDVADLPTGPLVLPPRMVPPPRTGEFDAVPSPVSASSFLASPEVQPPVPESPFARPATAPTAIPADTGTAPAAGSAETAAIDDPVEQPRSSDPADARFFTDLPDAAPPPAAPPTTGPTDVPPVTDVPAPAAASASAPASELDSASASTDPEVPTAPAADEPEVPERAATGQVNARGQDVSMDWAEALRTGAIPLPSRSRRSYAAPSKAAGQPVGPPRFEIHAVGRQRYEAVNVGGATAEQASVEGAGDDSHLVRPVEARPKPVEPGGSLAFSVLRVEGRSVSVRIAWMLNGDEEQAELPVP